MTENRPHRKVKHESLKTETGHQTGEVELGKPVRLPYIRKISSQMPANTRRSLEGRDNRHIRNSNKELKLFDHTQLSTLTLQEIELCN